MSKIKNGGLDQYGAEHFEQQQFVTAGVEGVKQTFSKAGTRTVYHPHPHHQHHQFLSSSIRIIILQHFISNVIIVLSNSL